MPVLRRYATAAVVTGALVGAGGAAEAWAQVGDVPLPWAEETPDVLPRRTLVLDEVRVFSDPRIPARESGFQQVSLVEVLQEAKRQFGHDPRFALPSAGVTQQLLELARDPAQQDLQTMAEQGVLLGMGSFRNFNLRTSIDELTAALRSFDSTGTPWLRPQDMAEAWLYVALAELELAAVEPDAEVEHSARARQAFKQMIRLHPSTRLSEDTFPASVVAAFEEAYTELLLDGGAQLGLQPEDATWLADRLDAELIVSMHAVVRVNERRAMERRLVLQVWDVRNARFLAQEELSVTDETETTLSAVDAALSRIRACVPWTPRPPVVADLEPGAVYSTISAQGGFFAQGPTRRIYPNFGVYIHNMVMATPILGVYAGAGFLFSAPDPDGDLVNRVDTTRVAVGTVASGRMGRFRVYAGGGAELLHTGRVQATRSFWCKVSEGEVFAFDAERACLPEDVENLDPSLQFGFEIRTGVGMQITGPLWAQFGVSTTFYLVPTTERVLDFPLTGDLGLGVRF